MTELAAIQISGETNGTDTLGALLRILTAHGCPLLGVGMTKTPQGFVIYLSVERAQLAERSQLTTAFWAAAEARALRIETGAPRLATLEPDSCRGASGLWVLTLMGRRITAAQLAEAATTSAQQGLAIVSVECLSAGHLDDPHAMPARACVALTLSGRQAAARALADQYRAATEGEPLDISLQRAEARANRRLVVLDMDSTLIQHEVIDELAQEAGAGDLVARITAAATRGELDFAESLRRRVATLEGLPQAILATVADRLQLTQGAECLLQTLRYRAIRSAVISGGFGAFARYLQRRLPLDSVCANELEVCDGALTGRVDGPIVDAERKAILLEALRRRDEIDLQQTVAIGDGANDLPMLRDAGLGIAYHAKPVVQRSAEHAITTLGLEGVLYLMGIAEAEWRTET